MQEERLAWEQRHAHDYFGVDERYEEELRERYFERKHDIAYTMKHVYGTVGGPPQGLPFLVRYTASKRVLEIGCGYGGFGAKLAPYVGSYTGYDIAPGIVHAGNVAIQRAQIPNMVLFEGDASDILETFRNRRFDIVFTTAVFIHTPPEETRRYLEALPQLLEPGGRFSHQINLARNVDEATHGEAWHVYTQGEYERLFEGTGLVIEHEEDWPDYRPGQFARIVVGGRNEGGDREGVT